MSTTSRFSRVPSPSASDDSDAKSYHDDVAGFKLDDFDASEPEVQNCCRRSRDAAGALSLHPSLYILYVLTVPLCCFWKHMLARDCDETRNED